MGEIRDFKSGRHERPPGDSTPRRLAAIVAGDIAGYSRLMQLDEEGTHSRVKRIERDLIEPTILEHHGKLVKTTGDGFIAMFDSPVEAVRCSIVIQQNLVGRNAAVPKDYWIEYRIGVNLGDVIIEPDDIYGDGVNVASRLEGIAEPGQVFISGGIYEQIKHKLVCGYESLGDRKVKNITDPVRVYRVLPDASAFHRTRRRRENILIFLLSITLAIIAGGILWSLLMPRGEKVADRTPAPASSPSPVASPKAAEPAPATKQAAAPAASPTAQPQPPKPQPSASPAVTAVTPPPALSMREPEMVALQGGSFSMGSNDDASERPIRRVTIKPFSIGKYPVTVREWNACAAAKACGFTATGKDEAPITNVSWTDAKQYAAWLADVTKKAYRLPSEAEWEFAARGGTQTKYWWGDQMQPGMAGCKDCGDSTAAEQPTKVGNFKPNPFGLHDMGGGVDQWVEDCWHKNYQGAPADASPWLGADCTSHVLRSGSWKNDTRYVRPANRDNYDTNVRYPTHGFRVALSP
ncbi:SUMF1/EgtB/PvdO family nonheme iron enzyme [Bradyrhizobium sp. Ai1a-2]|uniref:SUMF1/EgtB/PvdO family nonheme iron enzyme n=1 Tax=Bradyrhizobium sp. Ai1a-2 TaxID=196490 RepID=UPI000407178F|nr:SUMF1/EgtB/PvdO family nonheme iron enzyme [Bradyrhizobium sp. Ai1a-2]